MDRKAQLQVKRERQAREDAGSRAWLARVIEEEDARLRVTPEDLVVTTIADSLLDYTFSEDGSIGHVKMRVPRDPQCCAWAHFDRDDMDKLAPYLLYGRRREDRLQPYLGGFSYGSKDIWSVGRLLLDVDDSNYNVRYLNGNCLDNRRANLATYKVGQFPTVPYGPGWLTMRRRARARSGGVCERCRKQPASDVHHLIPVKFFAHPSDSHFLPNLLDLCKDCHRLEHLKLCLQMPLFYGLTLPAAQSGRLGSVHQPPENAASGVSGPIRHSF
jgi:5-methylcytosine-specific restriction endonuclease McrA